MSSSPVTLTDTLQRARPRRKPVTPGALFATLFLLFLLLAALFPGLFTQYDPLAISPRDAFQEPGVQHWFGTDQSGRDLFSRVIHGARLSLLLGIGAVALSAVLAIALGLVGGLSGETGQRITGWILDILFSFPTLILALLFSAHLGSGIGPLIIATGISNAPGYAKMVYGQILTVRHASYIDAARALGHAPARIITRQLLPNALRPLLVALTMGCGQAIVWSSALSFLGLGAPPPAAEWGTLLSMGRDFVEQAWWLTFFPGLFIVLTTLSTSVLGRYLQRKSEGRLA
ncbi:ABC transporter permease [Pantoea sp. At-9b]|uniref:ABC transporter permease n=1 Tax=Pantoea sp. (strain At-9b) TaxID=592316 RepID=UPI0001B40D03|nr:ABC transporter permease [Pantoea sp. At-9b]ADU72528.1 binding-protein-dependent transport systems inner membrane component [Pantoea sp. At-9b]